MITDHRHQTVRSPNSRFVRRGCGVCGRPNDRHLSYGEDIAAKIGGDPRDYVTGAEDDPGPTGAKPIRTDTDTEETPAMTTPTQQDANDVLFGGAGAPALAWQNPSTGQDLPVGTSYEGTIVKLDSTQQRNIQDKSKLDTWPDGRPKMVALVTIETTLRDPNVDDDDGQRTLWVSGKYLTNAVKDAVRKAGAQRLDLGGHLKVTLAGYGPAQQGFRAPRLFEVVYRKPQPGQADANAALGIGQPAYDQGGVLPQSSPVYATAPQQTAQAAQPPAPVTAGQVDLSSLPPDARALVEKMYAQQQGGAS